MKKRWLFLGVAFLAVVLFGQQRSLLGQSENSQITVTSFTVSDDGVGATGVTYTLRFKFGANFTGGPNAGIELGLNRIVSSGAADRTSNISSPTGSLASFKIVSPEQAITSTALAGYPQISNEGIALYAFSVEDDIPANTEVELQISGVTNPSKAGVYAFAVEARDNDNAYFSALPLSNPERSVYALIGPSSLCLKLKVVDPEGTTAAKSAGVYVHNVDHKINAFLNTDYTGMAAFFGDGFNGTTSCPSGTSQKMYLEIQPPASATDYARAPTAEATLPGDQTTHFDTPLRLSYVQIKGRLKTPDGDDIASAGVNLRSTDFDPTKFVWGSSDSSGYFRIGGLSEGTYVLEFQLPWGGSYSGITNPDPIQGIQIDSDGKVTYGKCGGIPTCDLGEITYPAATKTITGTVTDEEGSPVTDGRVMAFKEMGMGFSQTTTAADGSYTLELGGGIWGITVEPNWDPNNPPEWTFCEMPRFFTFADDDSVEVKNSSNTNGKTDFVVKKAKATVRGRVIFPDGTPFTEGGIEIRSKEGCGAFASLGGDGRFSTAVPPGTYNVIVQIWNENYAAPGAETITVGTSDYNVGDLTLVEKKDTISGRVWADLNGNGSYDSGEGVSGLMVEAFKMNKKFDEFGEPGGPGPGGPMGGGNFVSTTSGSGGTYSLKVTAGTWMLNVMSDPGMMGGYSETSTNYIYNGMPVRVNVVYSASGNTYSDNNFQVSIADATIKGRLWYDSNGNGSFDSGEGVSGVWGYAFADSGSGPMVGPGMGAPIQNGSFTIKVPAGTYTVGVDFPPDASAYTPSEEVSVTTVSGETATVNVPVLPNNSRIKINFVGADGAAVTDLSHAEIFAKKQGGGHIFKTLFGDDLTTGSTILSVCEGTWSIGYFIDPTENNYMSEPISKDNEVVVTASNDENNPAEINVVLRSADSTISGTVTDPAGNPLAGVWVSTDNRKASGFDRGGPMFMMGSSTDANGRYSISLPAGTYVVQAFLPPSMGYINPDGVEVTISPTAPATVNLQFSQSDATLTGSVYLDGAKNGAFITAYSSNGGYSETTTTTGDYSLNVTKDDTWYVRAMYESGNNFYQSSVYKVEMGGATAKSQDLTMSKASFTLPDAVSVTFDYQNAKTITLSNGFSLSIPAGAISPTSNATGNNITITITPTAQMSAQNKAIPIGIGYDITAVDDSGSVITSNFNSNVTITIPYTEEYLREALGITDESMLDNGYWDTTTSTWKGVTGATIDTENNTISFTVNHFTTFSVLAATDPSVTSGGGAVSSGTSSGTTSSGEESRPMAPKNRGSIVEGVFNRVILMIPAGALTWDADFEMSQLEEGFEKPKPPLWIAGGPYRIKMKAWWNGAEFTQLEEPITLIIRYDPLALGEIPEESLRLNYYDAARKRWRPINSLLITDRHEVAAVIEEIQGTYALIGGFGYQGGALYSEQTVTATAKSEEIGLTEEVLPKEEVKEEIKPTPAKKVAEETTTTAPRRESWFRRLLKKIFPFLK